LVDSVNEDVREVLMSQHRMVRTPVGALAVRVRESVPQRPSALLWHSLFVDDRSWSRVEDELAAERRLVLVTGPGHGASSESGHRYTMEDCAEAAAVVLDALGINDAVDWLGNAWGGHVGVVFATQNPRRCRTLVTVGTPIHAYTAKDRVETRALLLAYRLLGPARFLRDAVSDVLLSPTTRAQDPAAVELVRECFNSADRSGLRNAVVSISLHRADLTPLLSRIEAPALFVTGSDHPDWTPEQATTASRLLPHGSVSVLEGAAYLAPLETPQEFVRLVREFWANQGARSAAAT